MITQLAILPLKDFLSLEKVSILGVAALQYATSGTLLYKSAQNFNTEALYC